MRTRKSRLFIVLLHLVSVSTDINILPITTSTSTGSTSTKSTTSGEHGDFSSIGTRIISNPQDIVLQRLQLPRNGLKEILLQGQEREQNVSDPRQQLYTSLEDPFWLQDNIDGLCLSPVGFSDCSETTLWFFRKVMSNEKQGKDGLHQHQRPQTKQSPPRSGGTTGYALQYVEPTMDGDCLLHENQPPSWRTLWRRKPVMNDKNKSISDAIGPCQSSPLRHVYIWTINGHGVLHTTTQSMVNIQPSSKSESSLAATRRNNKDHTFCLWRTTNITATAVLDQCPRDNDNNDNVGDDDDDDFFPNDDTTADGRRLAYISLIRYIPASVALEREIQFLEMSSKAQNPTTTGLNVIDDMKDDEISHIPHSMDSARRHSLEPLHHAHVKSPSALMMAVKDPTIPKKSTMKVTNSIDDKNNKRQPLTRNIRTMISSSSSSSSTTSLSTTTKTTDVIPKSKFFTLQDTNPILFIGGQQGFEITTAASARSSSSTSAASSLSSATYKLRRLETHPYLKAAQNNIWTDPQTGLQYPTDLCAYLGHDLKQAGRHTLTGVGYYTKTLLNIKIYGVALYISKKDALADVVFEQFSTRSAEELRQLPDFYDHLREMPSPLNPKAGFFDRTILLKLNMQLSLETMQSSLRATWKLLTEERKSLLIDSSMKARPADDRMLRTIASPGNPGRCSCGQVAPPEYQADRECCARGTELVFTWRKNGDLEIRIDRRIVDTFPRPDVARGIFYEYLRTDDPISPDFTNHVVDGFPFLLGPLAQVKGMHVPSSGMQHSNNDDGYSIPKQQHGLFGKEFLSHIVDPLSNNVGEFFGWVHHGTMETVSHVTNAAQAAGSAFNSVKEGLDRRRDQTWSQVCTLPDIGKEIILRKMQSMSKRPDDLAASVIHYMSQRRRGRMMGDAEIQLLNRRATATVSSGPRGRVFRSSVRHWFGSSMDMETEHGIPIAFYTSFLGNFLFFNLVHLYLLLLLVVSLPGRTHQTKLVIARRRSKGLLLMMDDANTSHQISHDGSAAGVGRNSLSHDDCDSSTESSSTDSSPTTGQLMLSSDDTWTIGNEPISNNTKSSKVDNKRNHTNPKNLVSIFREKRTRSRSRTRLMENEDGTAPTSPKLSGMKKSFSYYL